MGNKVPNKGLQVAIGRLFNTVDAFAAVQSMSADDSTVAFDAGDDALDDGGAVANQVDANFDATPTRSGQTVTWVATVPAGSGNFVWKRIAIHNAAAASVSSSSATLVAGTYGLSITKTSDFALKATGSCTFSDVSV